MKHPDPQIQKNQKDFFSRCSGKDREFHALIFRLGNAAYIYHQLAFNASREFSEMCYSEWLEGLPPNISEAMKRKGFEGCKTILPLTRYVNERKDIGIDEWMKENLSENDFKEYLNQKIR
jgi:uncharacterized protein with NAD-binding domain and iron-sulfur cluster